MSADVFGLHMEATARALLGEPNAALSTTTELRFGSNGSLSVDLEKGVFNDHEGGKGGGVLDLIERQTGAKGSKAVDWLRETLGASFETDRQADTRPARIVQTYDYVNEDGEVVFQVCRMEPKTFRQRRPDGHGGWSYTVKGIEQVPYRLPQLLGAVETGLTVYVVEGEKDADALAREGLCATCNAGGAGKWPESFAKYLQGADVVILPDNDTAGRDHASLVAGALVKSARRVRVLDLPGLPAKGDVSDWLAAGGDRDELVTLTEIAKLYTPQPPPSRFGAIMWADLDSVTIRQDWLVKDMLFCGDAGVIFGASGSGKSFLTVDLGLSIARGVPFLGKATRQGSVIYQAGEGGKGLIKRQKAYRQENHVVGDVPFILLPKRADFFGPDGDQEAFISECLAWKTVLPDPLALIVIDTLSTATPGANENTSEDMSRVLQFSERLQRETGAAVLWVHHKNAAGERERGHTSLRSNLDTALEVIRDEDSPVRTLRVVKVKDGEDGEKIGFELQPVEIGSYDDSTPMTSCVVRPAQLELPRTSHTAPTKLTYAQRVFLSTLDTAICQHGGVLPPDAGADAQTFGVDWTQFRSLYKTIRGHEINDDALRQALVRDGDALHAKRLIGRASPWLWLTEQGMSALLRRAA